MGKILKFISIQVVFLILLSTFAFAQQFAPNNQALKGIQQKNPSLSLSGQEYNTDLFTGSASYSYEIEVPNGVNELKPQVSLSYNHHSSSADGPVGMGWNLNTPTIYRNINYSRSDTSDDYIYLSLNGVNSKLIYDSSDGRYHTEQESFFNIKKLNGGNNELGDYWVVKTKDGTEYRFGYSSNSELKSNIENYVIQWNLDLIKDSYDNSVFYDYIENSTSDQGTSYLSAIRYNNNLTRLEFSYSFNYNNYIPKYVNGNRVLAGGKLNSISTKYNDLLVKRYAISYNDIEYRKFLSSIQEFGIDGLTSIPQTNFTYESFSTSNSDFESSTQWRLPNGIYFGDTVDEGVRLIDFDGDGYTDILRSKDTSNIEYWKSNGVNGGWTQQPSFNGIISNGFVDSQGGDLGARFVDLNGDMRTDMLVRRLDSNGNLISNIVVNNNGTNFQSTNLNIPSEIFFATNSSGCDPGDCSSGFQESSFNCNGQTCLLQCTRDSCGPNWNYVINEITTDIDWNDNGHEKSDNGGSNFWPLSNKCYEYEFRGSAHDDSTSSECYDLDTIYQSSSYQRSCNNIDIDAYGAVGYESSSSSSWLTTLPQNLDPSASGSYGFTGNVQNYRFDYLYITNWGKDSSPSSGSDWNGLTDNICDNSGSQIINCAPNWNACNSWGVSKCGIGCAGESIHPKIISGVYEDQYNNLNDAINDVWACSNAIADNDYEGDSISDAVTYRIKEYDYNHQTQSFSCSQRIDSGIVPIDINSDGKTDIIKSDNNNVRKTWINTGNGFVEDVNWQLPTSFNFFNLSGSDQGIRFLDINSDGYLDVVKSTPSGSFVSNNNGNGWDNPYNTQNGIQSFVGLDGMSTGIQPVDLNADGYIDLIKKNGPNSEVYIYNGNDWITNNRWTSLGPDVRFDKIYSQLVDVNADGMVDVVLAKDNSIKETYINKAQKVYLLKKITNILGGETTINYKKIADVDNRGQDNINDLSFNGWVVSEINKDNGLQNLQRIYSTDYYDYSGGYFDSNDKEFRGFNYVIQNLSNGAISKNWFYQDRHKKGLVYRQEVVDSNSKLYKKNENDYLVQQSSPGYYSIKLSSQNSTDIDSQNNSETVETDYVYDNYGNIIQTIQLGDVNKNGDERYRNTEYIYNLTAWIVDKPKREFVSEAAIITSNKLSQSDYSYDGKSYGQPPVHGDVTKKEDWLDTGADPITLLSYDSVGNLVNTTDSLGHTTKYSYSPSKLYVVGEINALGHVTNYTYDERIGSVTQKIDANRFVTSYQYDVFGDLTKVIEPYDSLAYPTKTVDYGLSMRPAKMVEKQREEALGNGTYDVYHYYDGFGNEIQIKSEFNSTNFVSKNIYYDSSLRKKGESTPYLTQSGHYSIPFNIASSNYGYDFFDRVTKFNHPDNTAQKFNYTTNETQVYDENNKRKDFVYDAYDNIIQVREYNNGSVYLTNYDYDAQGKLLKITDSKHNDIDYNYDTLGRKIRVDDPDFGVITYTYDLNGNLYSQTYADGAQINFRYDSLNRLRNKYTTTKNYSYIYDTNTNGTLYRESTGGYDSAYSYDQRLRKVNETKIIEGLNYKTSISYDSLNRLKRIILPSGEPIIYAYGGNALVSNISGMVFASPVIIASISYDEYNAPKTIRYANSLTTTFNYTWPNHVIWKMSTGDKQKLTYQFDSTGNLLYLRDDVANVSSFMAYDDLHRLLRMNKGLPNTTWLNYNYAYDSINNLLSTSTPSGLINYSYTSSPVAHSPRYIDNIRPTTYQNPGNVTIVSSAVSSAMTSILAYFISSDRNFVNYDSKGNIISLLDEDYEYDSLNNLAKVYSVNDSYRRLIESYYYDGNGKRIRKITYNSNGLNITTNYISDLFVQSLNSSGRYNETYYKIGSKLLAQKDSRGLVDYVHEDYLGSVDVITNIFGNIIEKNNYEPFGKLIDGGLKSRYDYTGKENDAKTGLSYYGARYYSPSFMRFTQPDTVLADIYDPQQLNRYAYARNNPYKYIDPTGNIIMFIPLIIWGAFTAYDAYKFYKKPTKANGAWLASNFIGLGGVSKAVKGVKYGFKALDKLGDAGKVTSKIHSFTMKNYQKTLQSTKEVSVKSFQEANQLLKSTFPDLKKVQGAGPNTGKVSESLKRGDNTYAMDYLFDKSSGGTGRIFGHDLNNPHAYIPHINIKDKSGDKFVIFVKKIEEGLK